MTAGVPGAGAAERAQTSGAVLGGGDDDGESFRLYGKHYYLVTNNHMVRS